MNNSDERRYNQKPRRQAEFITPPNIIKQKVGSGGLSDDILKRAEMLLETSSVNFEPLAAMYLKRIMEGVKEVKTLSVRSDVEHVIAMMLYPAVQLRLNGEMFDYPLISRIADRMVQFLESLEMPDAKAVEIVMAFHTTLHVVVKGRIQDDGGAHGEGLLKALDQACVKYFAKYPENRVRG